MNNAETARLLQALQNIYPSFEVTDGRIDAWTGVLEPYPAQAVGAAANSYVREGHDFPPNPGQLCARIQDAVQPATDPDLEAARMWDKALTFIRGWAPQYEAAMDAKHQILGEVVRMVGGWTALRGMSSDDIHRNTRPHFLRLYAGKVRQGQRLDSTRGVREAIGENGLRQIGGAS